MKSRQCSSEYGRWASYDRVRQTPPATIQTDAKERSRMPEKKAAYLWSRLRGNANRRILLARCPSAAKVIEDTTKAFEQHRPPPGKRRSNRVATIALPSAPPAAAVSTTSGFSASLALEPRWPSQQCAGNNLCIGSPLSCQPSFGYGHACSNSNECEGSLSCDAGRCASPPVPLAAARKSSTPLVKVNPVYPREAIRSGIEKGQVVAQLSIDEKGLVTDVKIVAADPPGVFNREVTQALSQWQFHAEGEQFVGEVELNFALT